MCPIRVDRDGLETFVDRVFFQEEVEECLEFLKTIITSLAP